MDIEDMWEETVCVELEGRPYYPPLNWTNTSSAPSWTIAGASTLLGSFSVNSGTLSVNSGTIIGGTSAFSYNTGTVASDYVVSFSTSWKRRA